MRLGGLILSLLSLACCAGKKGQPAGPPPLPVDLVGHVAKLREHAKDMTAVTISDVRLGKDRVKVKVDIIVAWGGRLRYMAERPGGGTAADLASDGQQYCFVDVDHNCGECGPATPENVGRLVQVVMPPDDIVAMMMGSTPLIGERGAVTWDGGGRWVLALENDAGYTQKVQFDGDRRKWDVLDSEVKNPDGKQVFRIQHKGFHEVKKQDGSGTVRLPSRSYFQQPGNDALIEWKEHDVNRTGFAPSAIFTIQMPAGLPTCGKQAPSP